MTTRGVEIDRLTIKFPKPFEVVLAALKAAVGKADMLEFTRATKDAATFAELESAVHRALRGRRAGDLVRCGHGSFQR